jgi:hypothetical protein
MQGLQAKTLENGSAGERPWGGIRMSKLFRNVPTVNSLEMSPSWGSRSMRSRAPGVPVGPLPPWGEGAY